MMVNKQTLSRQKISIAVRRAILNVSRDSVTDVDLFRMPFEIALLKDKVFIDELVIELVNVIELALAENDKKIKFEELKIGQISHVLVPKKSFVDFRKCALIGVTREFGNYCTLRNYPILS